jgi:hypothetical protein
MRRPKKPRKMRTRKEKEKPKCVFKSSPFRTKAHQIIILNISKEKTLNRNPSLLNKPLS